MRKIAVITGSRAEYGLLRNLMKEIKSDKDLILQVIVTGSHLSDKFGNTYQEIISDGLTIDAKVNLNLDGDSAKDTTASIAEALNGFASVFERLKPDLAVVLGDRYEIHAAAIACLIAKIPLAHLHGGELSEGAYDDSIRHSITKMAHLHFTAAEPYKKRVIQMGEVPENVFCCGACGVENIESLNLVNKNELETQFKIKLSAPLFLITFHPTTLENTDSQTQIGELLKALDTFDNANIIFTQSNADTGNQIITKMIQQYTESHKERMLFFSSLGVLKYLSFMKICDVVIGNSSSGIIEAPALRKPTINIGDRQRGRLLADSIIQTNCDKESISQSIHKALSPDFKNLLNKFTPLYKGGVVAKTIKDIIKNTNLNIIQKKFHDINF